MISAGSREPTCSRKKEPHGRKVRIGARTTARAPVIAYSSQQGIGSMQHAPPSQQAAA